jgi:hypothetical protein
MSSLLNQLGEILIIIIIRRLQLDVTKKESIENAVGLINLNEGKLDALINRYVHSLIVLIRSYFITFMVVPAP